MEFFLTTVQHVIRTRTNFRSVDRKKTYCSLKSKPMLRWTIVFLVIALIAALLGFTGIAAGAASIAKIFFYIFIVLFLISLIAGGFRRS